MKISILFKTSHFIFIVFGFIHFSLFSLGAESADRKETISLTKEAVLENSETYIYSIKSYADYFVNNQQPQLMYSLIEEADNEGNRYALPYPNGHEQAMAELFLSNKIQSSSSTPISDLEQSIIKKYTNYSDEDLQQASLFASGSLDQKVEALKSQSHPGLKAEMINKITMSCTGCDSINTKDLAQILSEAPLSVDGSKLDWDFFYFGQLNENQKKTIMNALIMDESAIKQMSQRNCRQIRTSIYLLEPPTTDQDVFKWLEKSLDEFNLFSEYGLDPNFICPSGGALGIELIAMQEKALASPLLTEIQKKKLIDMMNKKKLLVRHVSTLILVPSTIQIAVR